MNNQEQQKQYNESHPSFVFRFASTAAKKALEERARANHRTLSGEINTIIEAAIGGGAK